MNWEHVLQVIYNHNYHKIFCLHGQTSPGANELSELTELIRKSHHFKSTSKIMLLSSRAQYIGRHKYEGLFFQQRYQASFKDQGETVRQRLSPGRENNFSAVVEDWKNWFELEEIFDKPLLQLSSGEWQRFSLCEGLMAEPGILIVPDLLNGLDQHWQKKILHLLSNPKINNSIVIFTADIPAEHSSVMNIPVSLVAEEQTSNNDPAVPKTLINAFQRYQSRFLSASSSDILIQMKGVTIRYGNKEILQNIHWSVRAGDKWNIQGPNGAGKSTLISLINADNPQGYSQPLELFGEKYGRYSIWQRKARIAYFGSDFFQYFRSTKTLEEVLRQQLQTPYLETLQPPDTLIEEALIYFGLDKYRSTPYSTLAFDLKRQILLIVAYLKSSDVLVLDEPYQDLSNKRIRLNNLFLESLQPQSQQTVIFVTHREDHKPRFLDKVLKIRSGKIESQ